MVFTVRMESQLATLSARCHRVDEACRVAQKAQLSRNLLFSKNGGRNICIYGVMHIYIYHISHLYSFMMFYVYVYIHIYIYNDIYICIHNDERSMRSRGFCV